MPDADHPLREANPVSAILAALREHGGLPTTGQALARLTRMLESDTEAVQDLANAILTDVSLTQRLLRVANTLPFRISGGPVTTVTRAIVLLGFNQIRSAAVSLVLIDGLASGEHALSVRRDFHRALLASSLARELLLSFGYADSRGEAEEAGIAAIFRAVGRLLVAVFAPAAAEAILAAIRSEAQTEGDAARKVLGRSFDEISDAALREWQLPDRVTALAQPVPPRIAAPTGTLDRVRTAAQFADEVTAALCVGESSGVDHALRELLKRYAAAFSLDVTRLNELIERARERTLELEAASGLPPIESPGERLLLELDNAAHIAPAAVEVAIERDAVGRPANGRDILGAGLAEVAETLARGSAADFNALIRIVLESVYTALGYARTALVLRDTANGFYRTRAGFGEPAARFSFSTQATHLFSAALGHGADLHIADVHAPKVAARLPDWFARDFPATRSFLLMPVAAGGRTIGFLYADREVVDPEGPRPDELNLLRALRNQLILALRQR